MKACLFTGHREVEKCKDVNKRLIEELISLINEDVTEFYAGGALGFDMMCEKAVISLRKNYPQIHLHLLLPCNEKAQTVKWSFSQKCRYKKLLRKADSYEYLSDNYFDGCMKIRNQALVDKADYCICYYNKEKYKSGTGQTVRMAGRKKIRIINLFI